MYTSFYRLSDKPFAAQPDPACLWLGPGFARALSALRRGIFENKGFVLLTGDAGTGKTILVGGLTAGLAENVEWAVLGDPGLERLDFYRGVAGGFGMQGEFTSKVQFLLRFSAYLHKAQDEGKRVVLFLDDCHRLSPDVLEELRLLSNIERDGVRLLAIVFVGRRDFLDTLVQPNNRAVGRRLAMKVELAPLSQDDTAEYIRHRLQCGGTAEELFTAEAVRRIYHGTRGIPRLINMICDQAMTAGAAAESGVIDREIVEGCLARLNLSRTPREETGPRPGPSSQRMLQRIAGLLLAGSSTSTSRRRRWLMSALGAVLLGAAGISYILLPEGGEETPPEPETAVVRPVPMEESPAFGAPGDGKIDKLEPIGKAIDLNIVADRKQAPIGTEAAGGVTPGGTGEGEAALLLPEPAPESAMSEEAGEKTAATAVMEPPAEPVPQPEIAGPESDAEQGGQVSETEEPAAEPARAVAEEEPERLPPLEPDKVVLPLKPNSLELTAEAASDFREFVEKLKDYPQAKLLVKGFVSAKTNSPENIKLSEERARGVEKLLVESGIEPTRIEVKGMGNQEPLASNDTPEGRARNRRVEVVVVDDGR